MRVLDLRSGDGGASEPFLNRGHDVTRLDIDPRFKPDVVADFRKLTLPALPPLDGPFDVVIAAPPCNSLSLASVYRHWDNEAHEEPVPKSWGAYEGIFLAMNCFRLIAEARPRFWVLENPVGMLANVAGPPKERIYWCSFQESLPRGERWKKPTHLWGRYPGYIGRPCIPHADGHRGNKSEGVQGAPGKSPWVRARWPYGLGEELCRRMEDS